MADVIEEIIIDSDENEEIIPKSPELLAETKKEIGNKLYKTKQYRSALPLYTEAIELCPETAAYYGNRAACYIMLNRFEEALDDARKSIQLDSNFEKGYLRILKCGIALGDLMTAENAARSLQEIQPNNNAYSNELKSLERLKQYEADAVKAYDNRDYRKVVYCMDRCMDDAPHCTRYQTTKAECLTYLGRYQQAQDIVTTILHVKRGNADAIYVRGLCLLYDDNIDSAFNHFQQVLRLAPDHKKAMEAYKRAKLLKQKKAEGNDAFKACRFQEAVQLYTEALLIDPLNKKTNSKLYFNRATALSRLTKLKEAVEDCNAALNLDNNYLKALLRRAKCYMDLSEYEDAVKDYEKAYKMDRSRDNKRLLTEAKMALKRAKRKDFYKILGVQKNASEDEIKKAYKKGALIHHPDRHASASENEKKEQEKKFKELGEAYSVLSDPRKKARYDNGEDLDETGGVQPDFDPAQVFQEFFGEGNGPGFFTQSGFPGGFSFQFG